MTAARVRRAANLHLVTTCYGGKSEQLVSHTGTQQNPLEALVRGLLAGVAGTVAMDLLLFYRFKRGGGDGGLLEWEFSAGVEDWSKAPAPAQVGKRLFEGFFQSELSPHWAALTNTVIHWAYGLSWGALYGILAGSVYLPRIRAGLLFGTAVWTADYLILPQAKLYKPMWEYSLVRSTVHEGWQAPAHTNAGVCM